MRILRPLILAVCAFALAGCATLAADINSGNAQGAIVAAGIGVVVTGYLAAQSNKSAAATALIAYANDLEAWTTASTTSIAAMQAQAAALIAAKSKNPAEAVALSQLFQQLSLYLTAKSSAVIPTSYQASWTTVCEWIIADATPFIASS